MEQIILSSLIQLITIGIACYFIFVKKYFKEFAKQTVELKFIKEKTLEIESVKKTFNEELEAFKIQLQLELSKEIEPLKSSLTRENIFYQITYSEFIKLKYQKIDFVYSKLYELKKYCQSNLYMFNDNVDFQNKKDKFYKFYRGAEDALYAAAIYIEDSVKSAVIDMLNEAFNAMHAFSQFYDSRPKENGFIFTIHGEALRQRMIEINNNSLERLYNSIDKLPSVLSNIEDEFRKSLTIKF